MRHMVACLILVLAACRVAPPALSEADKTAIRAATDSFVVYARARRNADSPMLFTENAAFMPPNAAIVEGRAAIRTALGAFPPMSEFSLTPVEIDGRGDLAFVRGTYAMTFVGPDGHEVGKDHGKFLEIRRRQPDGKWLIVADMYNSDVPTK